jgi:hypothetical protein
MCRKNRFFGDDAYAVPLSSKDERDLEFLRWLYAKAVTFNNSDDVDRGEFESVHGYHPFSHEAPASDGNFYPPGSPLREADSSGNEGAPLAHLESPSIAYDDESNDADEAADTNADVLQKWLRGTEQIPFSILTKESRARLGKVYYTRSELVIACVEAKIVPEDEVCEDLRRYLPPRPYRRQTQTMGRR